ncbi:hypothetical protein [Mangrovicoccus sp. HB161399]|uniref:hypothetical protein n=1 Tax=Mangrovicoccus sp. HB161399 TaxID=2720392 RepID=UPI0015555E3E|nr:hypothetical protein [Mangrovicoccus sp. HB161399]
MTYHIANLINDSKRSILTANPAEKRDTYFIGPTDSRKPDYNIEINTLDDSKNLPVFLQANVIYTARHTYSFWDSGQSQIMGMIKTSENPELLYSGSAGDLILTVEHDGTISFAPA